MHYQEVFPSRHLQKFIKCFWQLEQISPIAESDPQPVLPDGCFELIFNLSESFRRHHLDGTVEIQPTAIVVGQMKQAVNIEPTGKVRLFGIRFQPTGAFPFLHFSLNHLQNKIETLDAIWGKLGRDFEAKINESQNFRERITIAEMVLTEQLKNETDLIITQATSTIFAHQGQISIENLTNSLEIGSRQLERKFRQKIGTSPKTFCRIIRLQNVLQMLKNQLNPNLLDVAFTFGYYDQAHLSHEFKQFAGTSPLAFLEAENRLSEIFIGKD